MCDLKDLQFYFKKRTLQLKKLQISQRSRVSFTKSPKKNAFLVGLTKNILLTFNETVSETVLREEDSNQ